MEYDIIYSGMSICLINCFIDTVTRRMYYGFGYFTSNLPQQVILKDSAGHSIAIAELPSEITSNSVMSAMGDANGETNELKLITIF
jgi:hypothetical protein